MKYIIAIVSIFISTAASAGLWSNAEIKDLKNAISQVGVNIRHGLEDPNNSAIYDRRDNEIIMFTRKSNPIYNITLVHEAVHVLQDCYMGLENSQDTTLLSYSDIVSYISWETQDYVNTYYNLEDRQYEYEAEGYAQKEWQWTGGKTLAYMIRKYC